MILGLVSVEIKTLLIFFCILGRLRRNEIIRLSHSFFCHVCNLCHVQYYVCLGSYCRYPLKKWIKVDET